MWSALNAALQARPAVPGRAERDLLAGIGRVGVLGVVRGDEVRYVDQVGGLGGLAGTGVDRHRRISSWLWRGACLCWGLLGRPYGSTRWPLPMTTIPASETV